jgi:hypothetical protein
MNHDSFTQDLRPPELSQVLHLNGKADEIENSLPPHLRIGNDLSRYGSQGRALQLQAEIVLTR